MAGIKVATTPHAGKDAEKSGHSAVAGRVKWLLKNETQNCRGLSSCFHGCLNRRVETQVHAETPAEVYGSCNRKSCRKLSCASTGEQPHKLGCAHATDAGQRQGGSLHHATWQNQRAGTNENRLPHGYMPQRSTHTTFLNSYKEAAGRGWVRKDTGVRAWTGPMSVVSVSGSGWDPYYSCAKLLPVGSVQKGWELLYFKHSSLLGVVPWPSRVLCRNEMQPFRPLGPLPTNYRLAQRLRTLSKPLPNCSSSSGCQRPGPRPPGFDPVLGRSRKQEQEFGKDGRSHCRGLPGPRPPGLAERRVWERAGCVGSALPQQGPGECAGTMLPAQPSALTATPQPVPSAAAELLRGRSRGPV